MFTSIENMWVYFVLGLMTTVYQLLYDLGNRMGIIDKNYTIVNKTEDTIISIVFVVINVVLIIGLQDRIGLLYIRLLDLILAIYPKLNSFILLNGKWSAISFFA